MTIHITEKEYVAAIEQAKNEYIHSMSEFDLWLKGYILDKIDNGRGIDIIVEWGEDNNER